MSTSKTHSRTRSSSFHGRASVAMARELPRPKTLPELFAGKSLPAGEKPPKLTKLLLNVTIQRSLGPVQVVMSPENTVGDLVAAAVRQYVKEGRRPILPTSDPAGYDLHYSQFALESLDREEKLMALGSRNFFLCLRKKAVEGGAPMAAASSSTMCSKQAERVVKGSFSWVKFMDFLL